MIAEWIDVAALAIGRGIIALFGFLFFIVLVVEVLDYTVPDVEEATGTSDKEQSDKNINDIIKENLKEPDRYNAIDYRPNRAFSCDWSMQKSLSGEEVYQLKSDLENAGYFVHPYARDPEGILSEDWHWSRKNMGVWTEKPEFHAVRDDGKEVQITPDLSEWDVETEQKIRSTTKQYGYRDRWERENLG